MRYLFLDLDNTVTESRSLILPEMYKVLSGFEHVVVVSGAAEEQIRKQVGNLKCHLLAQNGNSNPLYKRRLTKEEEAHVMDHLGRFATLGEDQLEHRGAQISYSFVGHHAPLEIKKAYDPAGERRQKVLADWPLGSEIVEVRIAGTTCLDYFPRGRHKGYNVSKFIELMGWAKAESLYIGDALFPGGNDESVVGVIETLAVKNSTETLEFLNWLANFESEMVLSEVAGEWRNWQTR